VKTLSMRSAALMVLGIVAASGDAVGGQEGSETIRLRGQVLVEAGKGLPGATIRTDALRGIGGGQFAAQRVFNVRTDRNGEWSLLGVTGGLWVLEISAPDHLPHVVVIPIYMMRKPEPRPWDSSVSLLPATLVAGSGSDGSGARVVEAAERLLAGDRTAARDALLRLSESQLGPPALCALGDLALLLREPAIARKYFDLAASIDAKWYRPQLGIASASMMMLDFDRAIKGYAAARSGAVNQRVERMLSGAVAELQQIRTIGKY